MNTEDAIRAVIGPHAPEGRVDAVARILVERGQRQPSVAAIVDALAAVSEDDDAPAGRCEKCGDPITNRPDTATRCHRCMVQSAEVAGTLDLRTGQLKKETR